MKNRLLVIITAGFLVLLIGCLQMPTKIHRNKSTVRDSTAVNT